MSHLNFRAKKYICKSTFQNRARDCIAANGSVFEAARRHRPREDDVYNAALREDREDAREEDIGNVQF